MNETRDDWECIQDEEMARSPQPKRLPGDDIPELEDNPPASTLEDVLIPQIDPSVTFEEPAIVPQPTASGDVEPATLAGEVPALSSDIPAPPDDVPALAGDLYAVQLIAMESEQLAVDFVSDHQLADASRVRLGRDGEIYYVVLLGIYDTYAEAQAAAEGRGESLAEIEPWIRSLESIHIGMQEAEELIATSND